MNKYEILSGPFKPSWDSLRTFECPQWYKDAKLGIWAHWGAQSVPMYGDWYARNMYVEGSDQYLYHLRHYGHPSKFGYKNLVQLWKAEKFDPEGLMDLYVDAGAKYFVAQAMHHDYFFNYDSAIHQWNSVKMGPKKDIVQLFKDAAVKRGLRFGVTEHLGATFSWSSVNKGADQSGAFAGVPYDGNDKAFEDLYLPNKDYLPPYEGMRRVNPWYAKNEWWYQHWFNIIREVIDKFEPDLLYTDGPLPFTDHGRNNEPEITGDGEAGLAAVAHLYNTSAKIHGSNQAVYNQKDRRKIAYSIGVMDIERSVEPDIKPDYWQTDTCVGGWFYNVRRKYKTPAHVIEMFVDIISKNGNLLLNIIQRPDGSLDDECMYIVKEMAGWNKICAEGIYGTGPFRVSGEGITKPVIEGFKEEEAPWTPSDFRFVQKGNIIYAFQMRWPENCRTVIKTLNESDKVKKVRLLGVGEVPFEQPYGQLIVKLPDKAPTKYVNCLAIELV